MIGITALSLRQLPGTWQGERASPYKDRASTVCRENRACRRPRWKPPPETALFESPCRRNPPPESDTEESDTAARVRHRVRHIIWQICWTLLQTEHLKPTWLRFPSSRNTRSIWLQIAWRRFLHETMVNFFRGSTGIFRTFFLRSGSILDNIL